MTVTLEESLAIAVLRGDLTAAYALADLLADKRCSPEHVELEKQRKLNRTKHTLHDGVEVYHWPEFQALCKRLGVALELNTLAVEIRVAVDEFLKVTQEYVAIGGDRETVHLSPTGEQP